MLEQAQVNNALQTLADGFLRDLRSLPIDPSQEGWGQFVGQRGGTQIGLYGTCAGLIAVALAYGHSRIPPGAVNYLKRIWKERNIAGTDGARYFALTTRRAFFYMALRQAGHPSLSQILAEAEQELRERILDDGLFVSWEIDKQKRGPTGDEFSTAMAILAYGLTTRDKTNVPPELQRSATSLQTRLVGSVPLNVGVQKFYLVAIATALEKHQLARSIRQLVRTNKPRRDRRDQDTLYFWDYWYLGNDGLISRRDYFHVPSIAVDILLACASTAGQRHRFAALNLAEEDVRATIDKGLYYAGRELATSNNQAWMSLAFSHAKSLGSTGIARNRLLSNYLPRSLKSALKRRGSLAFAGNGETVEPEERSQPS